MAKGEVKEFRNILTAHAERYPKMEPADLLKLIYQNILEFPLPEFAEFLITFQKFQAFAHHIIEIYKSEITK